MTMLISDSPMETQHHESGFHVAGTLLLSAFLTFVLLPAAALCLSYLGGGAVSSAILLAYLSALLTNGPFVVAAVAIMAALMMTPRVFSSFAQHGRVGRGACRH